MIDITFTTPSSCNFIRVSINGFVFHGPTSTGAIVTTQNPVPWDLEDKTLIIGVGESSWEIDLNNLPDPSQVDSAQLAGVISSVIPSVVLQVQDLGGSVQLSTVQQGREAYLSIEGSAVSVLGFPPLAFGQDPYMFVQPNREYTISMPELEGEWTVEFLDSSYNVLSSTRIPTSLKKEEQTFFEAIHKSPNVPVVFRGEIHTWRWGLPTQFVPLDNRWPWVEIIDPQGNVVEHATPSWDATTHTLSFSWNVPPQAFLSTQDAKWKIVWEFVNNNGETFQHEEVFDVVDRWEEDIDLINPLKKSVLSGNLETIQLSLDKKPYNVTVSFYKSNELLETKIPDIQTLHNYWVCSTTWQIPSDVSFGEQYTVIWDVNFGSHQEKIYYQLIVVTPKFLPLMNTIRQMLDKYRKTRDLIQHYEDGEIVEGIIMGMQFINGYFPSTIFWTPSSWPEELSAHLALAAFIWILQSQHMLEGELAFDFSGQTVSLNYDRTSLLDGVISRAVGWLESTLTAAKTSVIRSQTPSAIVAGRPFNQRSFIWKVGRGRTGSAMATGGTYNPLLWLGLI